MDSYSFIDTIQVEKANARARYNRYNTIAKIIKVIEVFIAVALLSWSSSRLPTVFKVSAEYSYVILSYLLNQHVVFLVGNVIVVLCYVLSCHTGTEKEFGDQELIEESSKFSSSTFVKNSESDAVSYIEDAVSVPVLVPRPMEKEPVLVPRPMEKEFPSVETERMDQTMLENNNNENNNNEKKGDFQENENIKTESEVAAEMAIKEAAKRMERFKRTQSARLKREMKSLKPNKRELRRSVTESRRSHTNNGYRGSKVSNFETNEVDRLSNEEFQLVIEASILRLKQSANEKTLVED